MTGRRRFLVVVPPLVGHVNPAVGVAAALTARGHDVAWAGAPEVVGRLAGPRATVYPCATAHLADVRPPDLRGPAALKFLWESFLIPLAEAMAPGVANAVDAYRPDVVLVDQQTVAGAAIAEARGIPWATSATTSVELTDPLAAIPKAAAWLTATLTDLRHKLGAPGDGDLRFSPRLVLAFTTPELAGDRPGVRFVGPALASRPDPADFPWEWLNSDTPTVLVTLGTVNAGTRFLGACLEAFAGRPGLRAVVVDPAGTAGPAPGNVLLRPYVPQLDLLPHMRAVLCHAGHNTVCESLYHGLPLVVAPIRDDQPVVAQQVVDAGAGIRLRFGRATAAHIGDAIDAVLGDPRYRDAALRVQKSFHAAGGADAAATHLEHLAGGSGDQH